MVHSESGREENNCIFREEMSPPFLFGPELSPATWTVTFRDPESRRTEFLLAFPGPVVARLDTEMKPAAGGATEACWTLTITSLSGEGNRYVNASTAEKGGAMAAFLGQSLKHDCETGEKLRIS